MRAGLREGETGSGYCNSLAWERSENGTGVSQQEGPTFPRELSTPALSRGLEVVNSTQHKRQEM